MLRIILASMVLLAGFAGCSDAPATKDLKMAEAPRQPAPAPTRPMTKEERARLGEQEAVVARYCILIMARVPRFDTQRMICRSCSA